MLEMGLIIDNILNMTDEEFLLLRKRIKEFVEIEENATRQEKRAIYNDKDKFCEYSDIGDIFQELGCLFSYELHEIEQIGEDEDVEDEDEEEKKK
jgi:hypothetical protein